MTEQEAKLFMDNTKLLLAMCKVIFDNAMAVGFPSYQAMVFASEFFQNAVNKKP